MVASAIIPDKRVERSKATILAETYKLLTEAGIAGVSVDEVSRRSGVSKTTIYRHWPSRGALLLDACGRMGAAQAIPDTGSLKGDISLLTEALAEQLRSAAWATVLPSIIDAAERDPELAKLHEMLHAGLMVPWLTVAKRAKSRGELAPRQSPQEFVAAVVGALFYRRWFSKEPLDELFVKQLIRGVATNKAK